MMTFLAPGVCLIWGVWSLIYTLYRWKNGGSIKISTLLLAVIGIPVGIAYLCQYFGLVNVQVLAQGLGTEYYAQRTQQQAASIDDEIEDWEDFEQDIDDTLENVED